MDCAKHKQHCTVHIRQRYTTALFYNERQTVPYHHIPVFCREIVEAPVRGPKVGGRLKSVERKP